MKQIKVGNVLEASEMVMGCMRICRLPYSDAKKLVYAALDCGIDYFDHADVYGAGASEEYFGQILQETPGLREKISIQTKCTLVRDTEKTLYLDSSREYILHSVEESLRRLQTDYIDTFMLHHPDTLMEPEEIAEAFDRLHASGKVRHFGVSNFKTMDLEYLQSCLRQKLIVNQLQLSVAHTELIDASNSIKLNESDNINRNDSVLPYMRMHGITVQAWSSLQVRFYGGVFVNDAGYPTLNEVANRLAAEKKVSPSAIGIAWILHHPAKMQPLIGTTKIERMQDLCTASGVELSRAQWYELYRATLLDEGRVQLGNSNTPPAKA